MDIRRRIPTRFQRKALSALFAVSIFLGTVFLYRAHADRPRHDLGQLSITTHIEIVGGEANFVFPPSPAFENLRGTESGRQKLDALGWVLIFRKVLVERQARARYHLAKMAYTLGFSAGQDLLLPDILKKALDQTFPDGTFHDMFTENLSHLNEEKTENSEFKPEELKTFIDKMLRQAASIIERNAIRAHLEETTADQELIQKLGEEGAWAAACDIRADDLKKSPEIYRGLQRALQNRTISLVLKAVDSSEYRGDHLLYTPVNYRQRFPGSEDQRKILDDVNGIRPFPSDHFDGLFANVLVALALRDLSDPSLHPEGVFTLRTSSSEFPRSKLLCINWGLIPWEKVSDLYYRQAHSALIQAVANALDLNQESFLWLLQLTEHSTRQQLAQSKSWGEVLFDWTGLSHTRLGEKSWFQTMSSRIGINRSMGDEKRWNELETEQLQDPDAVLFHFVDLIEIMQPTSTPMANPLLQEILTTYPVSEVRGAQVRQILQRTLKAKHEFLQQRQDALVAVEVFSWAALGYTFLCERTSRLIPILLDISNAMVFFYATLPLHTYRTNTMKLMEAIFLTAEPDWKFTITQDNLWQVTALDRDASRAFMSGWLSMAASAMWTLGTNVPGAARAAVQSKAVRRVGATMARTRIPMVVWLGRRIVGVGPSLNFFLPGKSFWETQVHYRMLLRAMEMVLARSKEKLAQLQTALAKLGEGLEFHVPNEEFARRFSDGSLQFAEYRVLSTKGFSLEKLQRLNADEWKELCGRNGVPPTFSLWKIAEHLGIVNPNTFRTFAGRPGNAEIMARYIHKITELDPKIAKRIEELRRSGTVTEEEIQQVIIDAQMKRSQEILKEVPQALKQNAKDLKNEVKSLRNTAGKDESDWRPIENQISLEKKLQDGLISLNRELAGEPFDDRNSIDVVENLGAWRRRIRKFPALRALFAKLANLLAAPNPSRAMPLEALSGSTVAAPMVAWMDRFGDSNLTDLVRYILLPPRYAFRGTRSALRAYGSVANGERPALKTWLSAKDEWLRERLAEGPWWTFGRKIYVEKQTVTNMWRVGGLNNMLAAGVGDRAVVGGWEAIEHRDEGRGAAIADGAWAALTKDWSKTLLNVAVAVPQSMAAVPINTMNITYAQRQANMAKVAWGSQVIFSFLIEGGKLGLKGHFADILDPDCLLQIAHRSNVGMLFQAGLRTRVDRFTWVKRHTVERNDVLGRTPRTEHGFLLISMLDRTLLRNVPWAVLEREKHIHAGIDCKPTKDPFQLVTYASGQPNESNAFADELRQKTKENGMRPIDELSADELDEFRNDTNWDLPEEPSNEGAATEEGDDENETR